MGAGGKRGSQRQRQGHPGCLRRGRRDRRAGGQHLCTLPLRRRDASSTSSSPRCSAWAAASAAAATYWSSRSGRSMPHTAMAAAAPSSPASCRPSCSATRASSAQPCWAKANKESGPMRKHYERILHSEAACSAISISRFLDENSPSAAVSPRRTAWPSRNGHLPRHDNDGLLPEPRGRYYLDAELGRRLALALACAPLQRPAATLTSSTATSSPARTRLSAQAAAARLCLPVQGRGRRTARRARQGLCRRAEA